MVDAKEKFTCSGCTACANACPAGCIVMKEDEQGFLYPVIDHEKCIQCGLCDTICEKAAAQTEEKKAPAGYGAVAKDTSLQRNSSSGGVFSLLCEEIIASGGVVAGAAFASDYKSVRHELVDRREDLRIFRGAKYLQSELGGIFSSVAQSLQDGRTVLFSGTPCQVDGLKAYIGEGGENLICVDMICHGVPSPLVWKKYCGEIEKKERGHVRSVNFRYKKYSWEKPSVETKTEHEKIIFRTKKEDPYMRLFLSDFTLRPSCYECRHKGINRKSDITIADFWGIDKVLPELASESGNSLVLVHTEKGRELFRKIQDHVNLKETDPVEALKYNGSAVHSSSKPMKLEEFWHLLDGSSVEELADGFAPVSSKTGVKSAITHSAVYKLLKKGKKVNMENGVLIIVETE